MVRPADPDYYTQARDVTDIAVADILAQSSIGDVQQCFGSVRVRTTSDADAARLVVENTGALISPELIATLTEPFQRGTGRIRTIRIGDGTPAMKLVAVDEK